MASREIVGVHPLPDSVSRQLLLRCVKECLECAASCISCADAALSNNDQELIRVIRVALDCAEVCHETGLTAIRESTPDIHLMRGMIEGCTAVCSACAEESGRYATIHEHCRLCASACFRCKTACDEFLAQ